MPKAGEPGVTGSPPLVRLSGVSLIRGRNLVLDHVDLEVVAGRIITVVGPNGAGKSSLLKVALGLMRPGTGTVERSGAVVGYVPQRLDIGRLLPLSVRRFLAMAVTGPADKDALEAMLDKVGAGHVLARQVADLSGGELQRVLLARALLRRPGLLVLDEPVGGVDVAGQAELYDLIARQARDEGVGVLMVSHDLHVVMAATDHVVCLNHHVCCAGHPETVSRHPEYLALFGPRVAASLAIYSHSHDHGHGADGTVRPLDDGHSHSHGPGCRHG